MWRARELVAQDECLFEERLVVAGGTRAGKGGLWLESVLEQTAGRGKRGVVRVPTSYREEIN